MFIEWKLVKYIYRYFIRYKIKKYFIDKQKLLEQRLYLD